MSNDIFSRVERFLEYEQEVYGNLSVDWKKQLKDAEAQSVSGETQRERADDAAQTGKQASEEQSQKAEKPAATVQEQLTACTTLDELKQTCLENEDRLITDLDGANLVFGVGDQDARLMIIGEAPGEEEDKQGEPFVGRAGQLLNKILKAINLERSDVYIANILKYRPPGNRNPNSDERSRSLPFLKRQIELIDPDLILCLGKVAANTLLDNSATLKSMRGKLLPFMGRELMVTYHPAALLRNEQWKRPTWEDVKLLRKRYDEILNT